jgi:hypothetical protein
MIQQFPSRTVRAQRARKIMQALVRECLPSVQGTSSTTTPQVGAVDPAHAIEEKNQDTPNRDELESTLGEVIVAGRWRVATGVEGFGTHTWSAPRSQGASDLG